MSAEEKLVAACVTASAMDDRASEYRYADESRVRHFISQVLQRLNVSGEDAKIVADVLVAADLRGIESHGVARLESHYVSRLRSGVLLPSDCAVTVKETETSIVVDAGNGLGHPVARKTMERVIEKARRSGSACGAVRGSNH